MTEVSVHTSGFYIYIYIMTFPNQWFVLQAEPKEEVEHADILELNTIIGTLRQEKEFLEQEKVC